MENLSKKQSVVLRMPLTLIERIDEFASERGFGTRTQAIFYLINYALDEITKKSSK